MPTFCQLKYRNLTLLLLALVLLTTGCSGVAVTSDYRPGTDFSRLKLYQWQPPERQPGPPSVYNSELVSERVGRALEAVLAAKGLEPAGPGQSPQVRLSYRVAVEDRVEFDRFFDFEGDFSAHSGNGDSGALTRDAYQKLYLVIDFRAPEDGRLLWRGMAERRLGRLQTPAEREAFFRETVKAILEDYPPPGS